MIMRGLLFALAVFLGGCQNKALITSIPGGESKVFERPEYEVRGQTRYDQNWIDSQIEGGVAAFRWDRPGPRPPELDAPANKMPKVAPAPRKKLGVLKRIKAKITGTPAQAPTMQAVPYLEAPPDPPPPPKLRRPIDELLHPTK